MVACDQRPEGGGRVYLAYLDEDPDESDDTDVYVIYSDDLFLFGPEPPTWSAPLRVTDDSGCSPSSGCAQFHQDIDVDQTTGQVVVAWHDAREDPDNEKTKAYAAYSTQLDPLAFSANFAVRDSESDWSLGDSEEGRLLYGDYAGVAFRDGVFFFAGGDNSDHPLNPDRKAEVFVTPYGVPPEP